MKHLFFLLVAICLLGKAFSQNGTLLVNAGTDKVVCTNSMDKDTVTIGNNPSATGGTGKYTYCWETKHKISENSKYTFYASDYLDDTTSPNPKVIHPSYGIKLGFKLTVTDRIGNQASDSVYIYFSRFAEIIGDMFVVILPGDSAVICATEILVPSIPIDSLAWMPATGLSDKNAIYTYAKPAVTTFYTVYIRDTAGCSCTSGAGWEVYVIPSFTNEIGTDIIGVHYNKSSEGFTIDVGNINCNKYSLEIYSTEGKLLLRQPITSDFIPFSSSLSQLFFYSILKENKPYCSGKIIIND